MNSSTLTNVLFEVRPFITREDLLALANFYDDDGRAVSFYFSLITNPDSSHRSQSLLIKHLVNDCLNKQQGANGISKDLAAIVAASAEVRHSPSRLMAIFACHDRYIWQAFDLPTLDSISRLEVGRYFSIAPLFQARESTRPYCVVMVERGKARGFLVEGTNIQELHDRFRTTNLDPGVDDSRVGWSHHIEGSVQEHVRAYLKNLAVEIHHLMEERRLSRLAIGCREDLWSELEGQLFSRERTATIGRFHPPNFDVSPQQVLQAARPIFQKNLQKEYEDTLHKINGSVSHGVVGLDQVLENLEEGRVHTLVLGKPSNQMITECRQCAHLNSSTEAMCGACHSGNIRTILADEALIRRALLTDAEILSPPPGASQSIDGVAAWLRYCSP